MFSREHIPQSWGRYPRVRPSRVIPIYWRDAVPDLQQLPAPLLAHAYGRSYGDSCLNENGVVLDVSHLQRFLAFDEEQGLLRCEAGVSLAQILDLIVPRGWFLPVSPGTRFVSVGGAIANDIHGKNHHRAGTFGCHVTRFELLRSNGERLICSPNEHSDLFKATIGGLGLTGLILWAEFRLKRIHNPFIDVESIRYDSLDEFMQLCAESDQDFEYTVAWVDCLASEKKLGHGIFMRGNHNQDPQYAHRPLPRKLPLAVPFDLPSFTLNTLTLKIFNYLYDHAQLKKRVARTVPYEPFFYPLDAIRDWNRMYGRRGFFQYQCVVPYNQGYEVMREILLRISRSGQGSFLAVLKKFGDVPSPGLLSFPRPGLTLALDFANQGQKTLRLFDDLDRLVRASGGALYPAKDARMRGEDFQLYFPRWREFTRSIDPRFSSSFWRRMGLPSSVEALDTTIEV